MMTEQPVRQSLQDDTAPMYTSPQDCSAIYKNNLVPVTVKLDNCNNNDVMREQPVPQSLENEDSYMSTSLLPRLANYKKKLVIVTVKLQFYHTNKVRLACINRKEVQVSIPFPQHIFKSQPKGGLSHCYMSRTNSSRRTQHMMHHLTQSNNDWYSQIKNNKSYKGIVEVMNHRSSITHHINYQKRNLLFSAKKSSRENQLLECPPEYDMINILHTPTIKKVITSNGAICFVNRQLIFLLLPRKEVLNQKHAKSFIKEMKDLETKLQTNYSPRGRKKHITYEGSVGNYVTLGLTSSRFTTGLYSKVVDRYITIDNNEPVRRFTSIVAKMSKKYIPSVVFNRMNHAINDINIPPFSTIGTFKEETIKKKTKGMNATSKRAFEQVNLSGNQHTILPSIAFGRNTILPMHTDQDAFLSVVSIHCADDIDKTTDMYRKKCSISKYFTFECNVSVGLKSGDVLVFNPTVGHCISTLTDEYRHKDVHCVSHYFKSKVVSLNDNSIPFDKCI